MIFDEEAREESAPPSPGTGAPWRKVGEADAEAARGWRGRWLVLDYAQSFAWHPVRPLLRVWRADGASHEAILPAATFGRTRWIGLMPADLVRSEIWAAVPDPALFRIDRVRSLPTWAIRLRLAIRDPAALVRETVPGLIRTGRGRVNNVRAALLQEPVARIGRFARSRSRPPEPDGFDPVPQAGAAPPIGFLMSAPAGAADGVASTLAALRRQADPRWTLTVFAENPADLAGIAGEGEPVAVLPRVAGRDVSDEAWSGHVREPWLAWLEPGDRLPDWAVLALRAEIASNPDLALLTTDSAVAGGSGRLADARLEPGWSPDLVLSGEGVPGLCLFDREAARSLAAGLDPGEPSFGWRMLLRASHRLPRSRVAHLARVAIHHGRPRAAPAGAAGRAAILDDHLAEALPGSRAVVVEGRVRIVHPGGHTPCAIVMPTRDRLDLLRPAVESVLAGTDHPAFELVVADNGSSDPETLRYLDDLRRRPGARVVPVPGAFNFSRIVNVAVAATRAEIVVLLNNDTEIVEPGWLSELASLAHRPGIGAVGAKLLYPDGRIQHGGIAIGWGGHAGHVGRLLADGAPDHLGRRAVRHEVSAVTAACLAVSRERYDAVGGFDESFAVAFNDVDFCLRLQALGLRTIYTPHAVLRHRESASRGLDQGEKRARFRDERQRFGERWRPILQADPFFPVALSLNRNDERLE